MVVAGAVVVTAALSVAFSVGGSVKQSRDSVSASVYLRARSKLEQVVESHMPAGRAAVDAFVAHIRGTCPGVLSSAPPEALVVKRSNGALAVNGRELLLVEIANALEVVLRGPSFAARGEFIDAVKGLEWGDDDVTELIRAFVAAEAVNVRARVPNVCEDARAWVASGYGKVAGGANPFEQAGEAASERLSRSLSTLGCNTQYPEQAIWQVLATYQDQSVSVISKGLGRREQEIASAEEAIVARAVAQVVRALGEPGRRGEPAAARSAQRKGANAPTHACRAAGAEKGVPPSVPLPGRPRQR